MDRPNQLESVFKKLNPSEKGSLLQACCIAAPAAREALSELFSRFDQAVERSSVIDSTVDSDAASSRLMFGNYAVVGTLGEGGMGIVYEAHQLRPIVRRVALKVMKPTMSSRSTLARFTAEHQALALLQHPHIIRLLDAGLADGQPYFAMEFLEGDSFSKYCDGQSVSLRERLRLFIQLCHAVQYIHERGIIHRDLKPGNVLITTGPDGPTPKIIDFGVARMIGQVRDADELTVEVYALQHVNEQELNTHCGSVVGTPPYMSPEQASFSSFEPDARSDIYSLGVILYELLVGTPPTSASRLRELGYEEMMRLIREHQPAIPSQRLVEIGESAALVAQNRGLSLARLRRTLTGSLDAIVMKAIEKNRERRYSSAKELANELECALGSRRGLTATGSFATSKLGVAATSPNFWMYLSMFGLGVIVSELVAALQEW